ncbi:mucin-17-like [Hydra vulgaris]|uniref:Mucin-17-like n=1 Tax=Hydra vulgaris TaxID=6087 RepID=A0ABM4BU83_HYDVU
MSLSWNCFVLLCTVILSEAIPLPQASTTCDNGKYYPDPNNCNKFFICSNGQKLSLSCPSSLAWDNTIKACLKSSTLCQVSSLQVTDLPLAVSVASAQILNTAALTKPILSIATESQQAETPQTSTSATVLPPIINSVANKTDVLTLVTDSPQTTNDILEIFSLSSITDVSKLTASVMKETEQLKTTSEAPILATQTFNDVTSTPATHSLMSNIADVNKTETNVTESPLATTHVDELSSNSALDVSKVTVLVLNETEQLASTSSTSDIEFSTILNTDLNKTDLVTLSSESLQDVTQITDEPSTTSAIVVDTTSKN